MDKHTATEMAYKNGYAKGYADATPKWIPVTERLPEKEGTYIVHGNLGGVFGLFYDDMLSGSFKQMVTHWMPLPEPPKGE